MWSPELPPYSLQLFGDTVYVYFKCELHEILLAFRRNNLRSSHAHIDVIYLSIKRNIVPFRMTFT